MRTPSHAATRNVKHAQRPLTAREQAVNQLPDEARAIYWCLALADPPGLTIRGLMNMMDTRYRRVIEPHLETLSAAGLVRPTIKHHWHVTPEQHV